MIYSQHFYNNNKCWSRKPNSYVEIQKKKKKNHNQNQNKKEKGKIFNFLTSMPHIVQGIVIGYFGSMLPSSHIGVGPTHHGVHSYVRGRKYTPVVSNNFSCPRVAPSVHTRERKRSSNIKTNHKFHSKAMIIM